MKDRLRRHRAALGAIGLAAVFVMTGCGAPPWAQGGPAAEPQASSTPTQSSAPAPQPVPGPGQVAPQPPQQEAPTPTFPAPNGFGWSPPAVSGRSGLAVPVASSSSGSSANWGPPSRAASSAAVPSATSTTV